MSVPKMQLDPNVVERLSEIGATLQEIAFVLGVGHATIERRMLEPEFQIARERGMANLRVSLRRKQCELALAGDKTMLIWLGKQLLGQKDRTELSGTGPGGALDVNVSSASELLRSRIDSIAQRRGADAGTQRPN